MGLPRGVLLPRWTCWFWPVLVKPREQQQLDGRCNWVPSSLLAGLHLQVVQEYIIVYVNWISHFNMYHVSEARVFFVRCDWLLRSGYPAFGYHKSSLISPGLIQFCKGAYVTGGLISRIFRYTKPGNISFRPLWLATPKRQVNYPRHYIHQHLWIMVNNCFSIHQTSE